MRRMMVVTVMATVLVLGMAGSVTAATGGKRMQDLTQQIAVASRDGKVTVTMQFENTGASPVHVPRAVADGGELFGKHFTLTVAATGQEVPYVGPMVKRAPFGPADYLTLAPRARHSSTIDITRAYAFLPGRHAYQLHHAGSYVADLKQITAQTPVPSTPLTFTHTQP